MYFVCTHWLHIFFLLVAPCLSSVTVFIRLSAEDRCVHQVSTYLKATYYYSLIEDIEMTGYLNILSIHRTGPQISDRLTYITICFLCHMAPQRPERREFIAYF